MDDDTFLLKIEEGTLDPSFFNHVGHLRLAWIYLQRLPLDEAIRKTCDSIQRYATGLGASAKFHWTISEALVRLMHAAGASDPERDWQAFVNTKPPLLTDARAVLGCHYSPAQLARPEARELFLEPDLLPLPA